MASSQPATAQQVLESIRHFSHAERTQLLRQLAEDATDSENEPAQQRSRNLRRREEPERDEADRRARQHGSRKHWPAPLHVRVLREGHDSDTAAGILDASPDLRGLPEHGDQGPKHRPEAWGAWCCPWSLVPEKGLWEKFQTVPQQLAKITIDIGVPAWCRGHRNTSVTMVHARDHWERHLLEERAAPRSVTAIAPCVGVSWCQTRLFCDCRVEEIAAFLRLAHAKLLDLRQAALYLTHPCIRWQVLCSLGFGRLRPSKFGRKQQAPPIQLVCKKG